MKLFASCRAGYEIHRGEMQGNVNTRILFDIADNYLKQNPLY